MKAKLFVTDMDGTLLNSQRQLTVGVKTAIRKAVDAGVIFTVATGRMHVSALPYVKELGLDFPIITYNGALIKSVSGEELFSSYLDEEIVKSLLKYAQERHLHIQLYNDDKLYFREESPEAAFYQQAAGVKGQAVGDRLYEYVHKVPKMLIVADTPQNADVLVQDIGARFAGKVEALKSTDVYIELIKPGINKASAIARLTELYNIPKEAVLAIGDSNNDITMIKAAQYGVAMGNANETVKKVAKYQVADCNHDGIAEAIQRFCLE
ncbi:MAG: Cof-type HAD-IIB family hydrolase [Anaerovibrio sp.]|uniref:Cof-type HAD-IIB family hydrolase n=1 Tax=Anaerovibrio sp. TaxID=1872532 RepID=UPI0025D58D17|nr:Cof-type HAD-IIB family hydrolase [Anaerovibrio sp.]MCR5176628.1 Cof-type HAD-IIB family hydrolase [Anaerovibrio sp.]